MGAVKNAIQRDELDPTIMDLDPEKSLESHSSMDSFGGGRKEVQPPLNKDPVYAKYYRMLKMVSSLHDGLLFVCISFDC